MKHRNFRPAACAVAILAGMTFATAGHTQPIPVGDEFQVNTYTTDSQNGPTVARRPDGAAFVIWQSAGAQDGDRTGLFGQLVGAAGLLSGPEFQINTTTYLSQSRPDADADDVGNFVVVWQSDLQDGDNSAVVGQRFSSSASPVGTEFVVNSTTAGSQFNGHVARAGDGRFVVIFVDNNDLDGDSRGIFARLYDAAGAPVGAQFQVNSYTTSSQDYPDVDMAADGSFVVAWTSDSATDQDGDGQAIVARRFASTGAALGGEFIVNSYTTGSQLNVSVTSLPDTGFFIVWESFGQDGDSIGVFARRFDATGAAVSEDFQVNSFTTGLQFDGRAAPQADGAIAVTWVSRNQDGDNSGVFTRTFSASGVASPEVQVNTTTAGSQSGPAIANTGSFLVAWVDAAADGDGAGIFAQRFDLGAGSSTTTTMPGDGECGDTNGGGITATDALFVLQAAVGLQSCALCICDVAGGGTITATDALITLQIAVGSSTPLMCPPC